MEAKGSREASSTQSRRSAQFM